MTASVADLFVVLDSVTDPFSRGMKQAAADAEAQSKRMSGALGTVTKVGLGLSVAVGGIAIASVKAASDFQASMTRLTTQAGVSQAKVADLSRGVLDLAGQVGFSPTSLAESLYHVESNFESMGISSTKALELVKIAAEGAAVGGANLVDVTNAMTAAVASGIPGVQDMSGAMGALNKIVGVGDMSMQDLADAFGTGMLATVKGFGVTLDDVGAGLATFGDNNIRGAAAGTEFRMAIQALAKPAANAKDTLDKLGLTTDTLAQDMQHGGMKAALTDLVDRMNKAGIAANQQGQIITDAFGRKAGTGINILIGQFDRTMSKYPALDSGASGFTAAWDQTKNTFSQQMKEIGAGVDALGIRIGTWLIPQVSKLITLGQTDLGQLASGFTGSALKPVQHAPMHSAFMNQEFSAPSLTGWQEFGAKVHQYLTDIENDAKKLAPLGQDLVRFGTDVYQGGVKLLSGLEPTAKLLGGAMLLGLTEVGHILGDVVGPAFRWFGDFVDSHKTLFEVFAVTVLGTMAAKMTILGGINAAKSIVELATSIVQFPLSQAGQIGGALGALKTAYTGKDAAEGEKAVKGLSGAVGDLKGSVSGMLDKVPALDGLRLKLMGVKDGVTGVEQAASETSGLAGAATAEGNLATEAETAGTAAGGLAGKLGKFAMTGGIIGGVLLGVGMLANELGKLAGVGDHTGLNMDTLRSKFTLVGGGSTGTAHQIAQVATAMVDMSNVVHKPVQGLTDIDNQMAQLVTSGDAQQAKFLFDNIAASLQHQGINAQGAASKFPAYEQALKDAGDAAQTMSGQVQGAINTMQRQQGLDQFKSDVDNLTQSIQANGGALSGNSQQAQQNLQAFRNAALESLQFYQDQINAHAPMDQANKDLTDQYNQLEQVGIQFLGSKKKADDFLTSLGMIKPVYSTSIGLNTDPAYKALHGLLQTINTSYGTVQVSVSQSGLGMSTSRGAATPGYGDGGWVKGGPKGAAVPAILHVGEFVVSEDMQTGRAPIDPRVLSGGSYASAGYAGTGGGGGTTVVNNYYSTVHIAGSVMTEDQALAKLRTVQLQWSTRNSRHNGWSVP